MSKEHPTNKAASVRDKLYNLSQESRRDIRKTNKGETQGENGF